MSSTVGSATMTFLRLAAVSSIVLCDGGKAAACILEAGVRGNEGRALILTSRLMQVWHPGRAEPGCLQEAQSKDMLPKT